MRFKRLSFPAFGPFTDFEVDLDLKAGLHIFYGPNESGKSSALRAVRGLLYGIPSGGRDEFKHPGDRLRLQATLQHANGGCLTFSRLKGRGSKTLRDADNQPLDVSALHPYIGSVGEDLFDRLYGLDHRTLSAGGKALLAEGGDIGESLFAAGLGPNYRKVRDSLQKEADELWKDRSRSMAIDKAIKDYQDALAEASNKSASVEMYRRLKSSLDDDTKQAAELVEKIRKLKVEWQKLKRFGEAAPIALERSSIQAELEEFKGIARLQEDFSLKRRQLEGVIDAFELQLEKLRKEKEYLLNSLEGVPTSFTLVSYAERISGLNRNLGRVVEDKVRQPVLKAEISNLARQIDNLSSQLGFGKVDEQAHLPSDEDCQWARELSSQYVLLSQKKEELEEECARLGGDHERLAQSLTGLGGEEKIRKLEMKVVGLRSDLKLDAEIEALESALAGKQLELEASFAQLSFWSGSLEALQAYEPPQTDLVQEYQYEFESLEGKLQQVERDMQTVKNKGEKARVFFEGLNQERKIGSRDELSAMRQERDVLWKAFLAEDGLNRKLQSDFEQALSKTDRLADQILDHASWITELEQAKRELEQNRVEWVGLSEQRKKVVEQLQQLSKAWSELWDKPELCLAKPSEMLVWLVKYRSLTQIYSALAQLETKLSKAKTQRLKRLQEHCKDWEDLFEKLEVNSDVDSVLSLADILLEPLRESEAKRKKELIRLENVEKELQIKKQAKVLLLEKLASWELRWAELMQSLPGKNNTRPGQLESLLQKYLELRGLKNQHSGLLSELERIDSEVSSFTSEVALLRSELGEALDEEEATASLERLAASCSELGKQQVLREQLLEAQRKLDLDAIDLEQHLALNYAKHKELLVQAGSGLSREELELLERQNNRRYALEERLRALEVALLPLANGRLIEEFVQELQAVNWDELPAKMGELEESIESLEVKRDLANRGLGELDQKLSLIDGDEAAALAAQEASEAMAEGKDLVLRYARLAVARAVLAKEMERYRRENEAPLLRSASGWFSRLTDGAYSGLAAGVNPKDDRPRLEAISDSGRQIAIDGLSDGTRDQLYLALRLAAVAQTFDSIEPMPMVLDDVLVHFDSKRAKATLAVLQEFAKRCQVLLFSHLERDRRLAKELSSSHIQVIDLEPISHF